MHFSLKFLASTLENIPQDHNIWSPLQNLATRLLSTLHFAPSRSMIREHHNRLALRMNRRLGNATYPPRTYSPTPRDCLFSVSMYITAGHMPDAEYHHGQAFRETNSEGVTNLATRFFVMSRLSRPLNHYQGTSVAPTPPNSPTASPLSWGIHELSEI